MATEQSNIATVSGAVFFNLFRVGSGPLSVLGPVRKEIMHGTIDPMPTRPAVITDQFYAAVKSRTPQCWIVSRGSCSSCI